MELLRYETRVRMMLLAMSLRMMVKLLARRTPNPELVRLVPDTEGRALSMGGAEQKGAKLQGDRPESHKIGSLRLLYATQLAHSLLTTTTTIQP
jgi:hypothetical protein